MIIYPAIDLYDMKAVRLFKGDYNQMTVYSENPVDVAKDFQSKGATHIHIVDLEGAKSGNAPNIGVIEEIADQTSLFIEVGGGIRKMETLESYFKVGVNRAILGTAAVTDKAFLKSVVEKYGDKIAVGADIKDGKIAIKGWTEKSELLADDFFAEMEQIGVKTIICTDISRDGAMRGTNLELYRRLSQTYNVDLIASGGVSSLDDVIALNSMDIHGAIIGKAYYVGAIDLKEAIGITKK